MKKIIGQIVTISYADVLAKIYNVTSIVTTDVGKNYITTEKWKHPKNSYVIIPDVLVKTFEPK